MANITQRSNGKWQAKIRRTGWPVQSKAFDTRTDAQKWARATEREMDIGAFVNRVDAERTTFGEAADRYTKEVLPRLKGQQQTTSLLKKLTEVFGEYSLASINAAMISSYRDNRMKIVSPQTVKHELGMLSRVFKACTLDWGIALPQGIPTSQVRMPTVSNARQRRLVSDEWELLRRSLAQCKSPYPLAAVELAIETAARQSELCSLVWKNVDLLQRTARLHGIDGLATKNGDQYRDIPLSSRAVALLSALPRSINGKVLPLSQNALKLCWERAVLRARTVHVHAQLVARLVALGFTPDEATGQIRAIVYKKKSPSPIAIKELQRIQTDDHVLQDLHFHDLRHEGTSRLAEKLGMHELMKVTGHKSSAMLARYYHPRATDLAQKLR
jgi:integrase